MKLFILEPCKDWECCGGYILILAKTFEEAKKIIHAQFRKDDETNNFRILKEQKRTLTYDYIRKDKKRFQSELAFVTKKEEEFNQFKKLSDDNYIKKGKSIEGVGKEFKNVCGHYWELVEELPTSAFIFENGKRVLN